MLRRLIIAAAFFGSVLAVAAYDPEQALFTRILAAHVHRGVVDYAALKKSPEDLDRYVASIGEVTAEAFQKMGRDDQMAYLINAYNAFTLKLVTDFYPVDSIRDIGGKVGGGFFSRTSKQWQIRQYEVEGKKVSLRAMGQPVTLDELENHYLRSYHDPRVHFALVCAAVSSPFLRSEAYVGARLSAQLDDQGRQFLADPFRNAYDPKRGVLSLSKLFDWDKEDFSRAGDIYDYVRKFLSPQVLSQVQDRPVIKYIPFDWSLNSRPGQL